jgi:hypothetical protein
MLYVVWASLQLNVVLDKGSGEGFKEVQFNDMPVNGSENGVVQFNNVPVT